MWLVLCSPADRPAIRAACGMRDRGMTPTHVIGVESLLLAPFWEHRLAPDGAARSVVRLHDGRVIEAAAVRGVLNRLAELPDLLAESPAAAARRERAYIRQERAALMLSWLASLPNVINAPTPAGLAGAWHPPAQTQWLAARAGLAVLPDRYRGWREGGASRAPGLPRTAVLVLDGRAFGPRGAALPAQVGQACAAYARLAGTRLVGLDLIRAAEEWVFDAATPMPDLGAGGPEFLDALTLALRNSPGAA